MKVYVVQAGEYSARHICGIFSSEELAKHYVEEYGKVEAAEADSLSCREVEVDAHAGKAARPGWDCSIRLSDGAILWHDAVPSLVLARPEERAAHVDTTPGPTAIGINVVSLVSADHARKLAAEARQRWLRQRDLLANHENELPNAGCISLGDTTLTGEPKP